MDGIVWRQIDYDTNKMIKCVKGEGLNGYLEVKANGKVLSFKENNKEDFVGLLCAVIARKIDKLAQGQYSLVPVPNSGATVAIGGDFRTLQIATRIAGLTAVKGQVVPTLRWKTAMLSSRKGGSRDPQILCDNLAFTERPRYPAILLDDVMTTGAHMIACQRKLMASGITPEHAISVGRATSEQKVKPIGWSKELVQVSADDTAWDIDF